jgi:DNA-binding CsgD family transcriptional regulator
VTWAVSENLGVHLAWCRADPEQVVERSQLLRLVGVDLLEAPGWLAWPVHHASALVQLGRAEEAEAELARLTTRAVERGSRSRLAALARVQGELATVRREHRDAREHFEEALRLGGSVDALERGVLHTSYGRFHRRRGERRAAREHLDTASRIFRALGAAPFLAASADELAPSGGSTGATPTAVLERLTPQERIVVGLAVEGLTNHEVAQQLVLSVKTVGYHLANAYAKLGVHSRAQLVTRVRSADSP